MIEKFKKIPRVDFTLEEILTNGTEHYKYLRIDLELNGITRNFIRIENHSNDILGSFLDEVAQKISSTIEFVEYLIRGKGGGYLYLIGKDTLEVRGSSTSGVEKNRDFTVDLLKQELKCEVRK